MIETKKQYLLKHPIRKNLIICLLSLFMCYGTSYMFKENATLYTVSNSVFSIGLFIICYFLTKCAFQYFDDHRLWICAFILGFFFSGFMICGTNLLTSGFSRINMPITWVKIISGTFFWAMIVAILFKKLPKWTNHISQLQTNILKIKDWSNKKFFLICWILIFVAWIPGFLASFPGIYGYDSIYQVNYYVKHQIILHHPLIHTYLLGFCVITLGNFFHSIEVGMAIYSVFQMLCLSFCFSTACSFLRRIKTPQIYQIIILLLFMFLPTNMLMSFSSTKDVIYAGTLAVLIVLISALTLNNNILKKKSFIVGLILISFINIIFRSQGIYVFVISMIIGMILNREIRKKLFLIFLCILLLYGIYSGPITKLAGGIKEDSTQEMMSVPIMQLYRAVHYNNKELSKKEKKDIAKYIPNINNDINNIAISDGLKNTFNSDLFKKYPKQFILLWAEVGKKCPTAYFDGFTRLSIGLWYPDMNYRDPKAYHPYWEYLNTPSYFEGRKWIVPKRIVLPGFNNLSSFLDKMTYYNTYQKIPVISMLLSSGFAVWIMLLTIVYYIYKKSYHFLYPVAFLFFLWLTLLLGPVVLYRYVYPIVVCLPIVLGLISTINKQNN